MVRVTVNHKQVVSSIDDFVLSVLQQDLGCRYVANVYQVEFATGTPGIKKVRAYSQDDVLHIKAAVVSCVADSVFIVEPGDSADNNDEDFWKDAGYPPEFQYGQNTKGMGSHEH